MPEIKLQHVVSCSSEDKNYPAENLIHGDGFKKWKSAKPGEKQISVTFQLEKATKIEKIDIGNDGSAFVEVLVGKSSASEEDFQVILVASSFMTPLDSRSSKNMTSVRMFSADQLSKNVLASKWDRVKVVCTQPFNKTIQYGLAFIKFYSPSEEGSTKIPDKTTTETRLGNFKLKPEEGDSIKVGSLFSSRDKDRVTASPLAGAAAVRAASKAAEESQKANAKVKHDTTSTPSSTKHSHPESASQKTSNKKKSFHKQSSSSSSESKDEHSSEKQSKATKTEKYIPFKELLKNVVFVMSGYQNPERGHIRDKAMEMGATYKSDWGSNCTHLICAFENTPKYNQVKGKGRIVNKKWVLDCYKAKRLLPWRRYRIGHAKSPPGTSDEDGSAEDEEEPKQKKSRQSSPHSDSDESDDYSESDDTEDEIRKLQENEEKKATEQTPNKPAPKNDDIYDASTDEEMQDQPTNGVSMEASDTELPDLPDLFRRKKFFFYGDFKPQERRHLRRFIIAYNGTIEDYMTDDVSFVLTKSKWDENFDKALASNPSLAFIKPQWLYACDDKQKYVPYQKYAVMPE